MPDTYIICACETDTVTERVLGEDSPGTELSSSIQVVSDSSVGTIRGIYLTRSRVGNTTDHYTFPNVVGDVQMIWAHGPDNSSISFGYHGAGMDPNSNATTHGSYILQL